MSKPTGTGPASVHWKTSAKHPANRLAEALSRAGLEAKAADNGYAVHIFEPGGKVQRAIVWLPIGETTFNDLGNKYLWGRTGDEHQAPDSTDLPDLVEQIVSTLR